MHRGKNKRQKPNVEKNAMFGTFSDMCPECILLSKVKLSLWDCHVVGIEAALVSSERLIPTTTWILTNPILSTNTIKLLNYQLLWKFVTMAE